MAEAIADKPADDLLDPDELGEVELAEDDLGMVAAGSEHKAKVTVPDIKY